MKNIITASIEFSFKGKRFSPSLTIELDTHLQSTGCIPNLFPLIARENNIDLYSYEYEMMLAEVIKINQAEGLINEYVVNDVLDISSFEQAWKELKVLNELQAVAQKHLNINDITQHPELKQALLAAHQLGKQSPN